MITLAHLSDIHLAPLPPVRLRDLLSKRITGWLNWRLNRDGFLHPRTLADLVAHLEAQDPDVIAVTGDLVNLALPAEFDNAAKWLEALGPADKVAVVPGNHDAYVRGTVEIARERWGAYMAGETLDDRPFPFVRRIGDLALIGCRSGYAMPPFVAAGRISDAQCERLHRCLSLLGEAGFYRVVLIHHPPIAEFASSRRLGLYNAERFRAVVAEAGAEMILHGHTHRSSMNSIPGKGRDVPVIGVASASADPQGHDDPARYNLFAIERVGEGWSCTMREYGYQRIGEEIVLRLQMRIH